MSATQDTPKAVAIMVLATAVLAVSDTLVRLNTETLPIGQFLIMRGSLSFLIFLAFVVKTCGPSALAMTMRPVVLLRALLEASSVILYIASLQVLMIAEVTAIYLASPLLTGAIVILLGLERVSRGRWIALSVGFVGVLLVMRPDVDQMNVAAILALTSAALVGLRDIVTRRMSADVPSSVVTLTTTTIVALSGLVLAPFEPTWEMPGQGQMILLISASIVVCFGNFLAVAAFRLGELVVVSMFRYASLPFALLVGLLVWNELPDFWQLVGSAIVILSGLVMLAGDRAAKREQRRRIVP